MSSGYSRPAGKRKQDNFLEPLLFPGIQALMAGDRRRPLRKGLTGGGPGEVAGPEKGDRPLPSNLSLMTLFPTHFLGGQMPMVQRVEVG